MPEPLKNILGSLAVMLIAGLFLLSFASQWQTFQSQRDRCPENSDGWAHYDSEIEKLKIHLEVDRFLDSWIDWNSKNLNG